MRRPKKTPRTTQQYRDPSRPQFSDWKKIARAYVVTKALNDFGEMEKLPGADTRSLFNEPMRVEEERAGYRSEQNENA